MTKAENLLWTSGNVKWIIGATFVFATAWIRMEVKSNSTEQNLLNKISEMSINNSADGKIINSKIENLTTFTQSQNNRINEFEKWKYIIDTKLSDEIEIKRK